MEQNEVAQQRALARPNEVDRMTNSVVVADSPQAQLALDDDDDDDEEEEFFAEEEGLKHDGEDKGAAMSKEIPEADTVKQDRNKGGDEQTQVDEDCDECEVAIQDGSGSTSSGSSVSTGEQTSPVPRPPPLVVVDEVTRRDSTKERKAEKERKRRLRELQEQQALKELRKRPELLEEYVVRSGTILGESTRYAFNKYEMPPLRKDDDTPPASTTKKKTAAKEENKNDVNTLLGMEKQFARFVAKLVVLLSRSSGRDKIAAFFQYGSIFWGNQNLINITGIPDSKDAPWRKLEESMSGGRKVFRLFKWVKEYEKLRLAIIVPDSYLGVVPNKTRALITRMLSILAHCFSTQYYFTDNIIWAAQVGLLNRPPPEENLRELLRTQVPYEKYVELHSRHLEIAEKRVLAAERINKWKDWKNWASLRRLVFAILLCMIQLKSLSEEKQRLEVRYEERIRRARNLSKASPVGGSPKSLGVDSLESASESSVSSESSSSSNESEDLKNRRSKLISRYDSMAVDCGDSRLAVASCEEELVCEKKKRIREVCIAEFEQKREMLAAVCNLGILLQRLNIGIFKHIPLWGVGLLGIGAAICGVHKNWPQFDPQPKQSKVARSRSDSMDRVLKK